MKDYKWIVEFKNNSGKETVYACSMRSAVILACANRLNKGFHISVESVTDEDNRVHRNISVEVKISGA